jgi:uncharacterized protein YhdP
VLNFPQVNLVVSWTSLPFMDLRLNQLAIDRPQLSIRRDASGRLHVAGIEFDPEQQNDDSRVTEWLLRQPSIVVSDALVTWTDELRHAPQLVLDNVQFRLEHSFGHHRFGLVGTPPADLAAPLDFRGDVTDASLRDWRDARGRFYVRLDYADIALWREWIPLPIPVDSGKGALRAWFDFAEGAPTGMVADFRAGRCPHAARAQSAATRPRKPGRARRLETRAGHAPADCLQSHVHDARESLTSRHQLQSRNERGCRWQRHGRAARHRPAGRGAADCAGRRIAAAGESAPRPCTVCAAGHYRQRQIPLDGQR